MFKCTFSDAIRRLRLHKEIRLLFKLLRRESGIDFHYTRLVVGYRVEQNAFLRLYALNFVELHDQPVAG